MLELTHEDYVRSHSKLCSLKECLDGSPSSEALLSSIQARDHVLQRAYLTVNLCGSQNNRKIDGWKMLKTKTNKK